MTIGIIGAGKIGRALATCLSRHGFDASISNSHGPVSLAALVKELGPKVTAATRQQAAKADIVFLAVLWENLHAVLDDLPAWGDRIVVDCTNPMVRTGKGPQQGFQGADLGGRTSSELVAERVPGARVVKAFNTLTPEVLTADPHEAGGRRVIFFSGDKAEAKQIVARLIERMGFAPVDLGGLAQGGRLQQFPGGPFAGENLIQMN